MKKIMVIACVSVLTIGCNNQAPAKEGSLPAADSTAEKIEYAYLPESHPPDYWDRGDQKNVAIALKALKGFETGNIEESLEQFADSVAWSFDGFDARISKDSMRTLFKDAWKNMKSVQIKMDDYEAVISRDKKEEFVTLWYKQIVTDRAGKTDSMSCVNDFKIEKGKIALLDETTRKYPAKK
ncbi:MAG: hypothetical protein ABIQ88_22775 [Chitinophagaceae bacterium]